MVRMNHFLKKRFPYIKLMYDSSIFVSDLNLGILSTLHKLDGILQRLWPVIPARLIKRHFLRNNHNAVFGYRKPCPVFIVIITDHRVRWNLGTLVDNRLADPAVPTDVHPVHQD